MHPTRREMLRLGLGSSALLACGPTVPLFLARSASALADDEAVGEGPHPGRRPARRRQRRAEYRGALSRRRVPQAPAEARDPGRRGEEDRRPRRPAPVARAVLEAAGAAAAGDRAERGLPQPEPVALRQHGDLADGQDRRWTRPRPAGWPARSTAAPGPDGDAPGLHIHEAFPLPGALAGGRQVVPSLARLEQFRRRLGMPEGAEAAAQIEALDRLARQDRGEPGSLLQFVERCSLITYASSARLERLQQDGSAAKADYPEFYGLARRLRLIAQLIKAGLSTPIYYTHLDGFDTHSGQLQQHASLLRELGASLKAFLDDLEKSGESERVLVLVFSEFGRRLGENGSGGTDHGTAAPVFLLGQPVKAGLHGPYPDLTRLEDGDPIHAVDFRRVYATLLDRWLGVPHRDILGAAFEPMELLRG